MLANIIILGGNSLVPGFDQRVKRELTMLADVDQKINIVNEWNPFSNAPESENRVPPDRQLDPLLGALKFAKIWQESAQIK